MKFKLTISRNSRDVVGIQVKDENAGVRFLDLELTLEQYAQVITGLGEVEVDGVVRSLECVGKIKIREDRSVVLPTGLYRYDKQIVVEYLKTHHQEDGWILNLYLGSKNNFSYDQNTNEHTVHYSVYRFE